MIGITGYRTAAFFGLQDEWLATGDEELTHLHQVGTGIPVMFLHGSGTGVSAAANWYLTIPAVAGALRAIAPDLLGFGATIEGPQAAFGIREWGVHTLRILDRLEIEKTWLVGNSLGGWIALQLAIEHPDRLLGVISMGTGGSAPTAAIAAHADPDTEFSALRRSLEGLVTDPSSVTDDMVLARQEIAEHEVSSGRLARVIEARERDRAALPLSHDELQAVSLPVLLVHGLQDRVIPPSRSLELAGSMPSADVVLLNQCGHWSQIERAKTFNELLLRYIFGEW